MKLNSKGFGVLEGLLILVIVGIIGGVGFYVYSIKNTEQPKVLVWGVDETVAIPKGLKADLEKNSTQDCIDYRGTDGPDGVALFAVQSANDKYAKMTYGCSDYLLESTTVVAVPKNGHWELIQPVEYYDRGTPRCEVLDKYGLREYETECVTEKDIKANNELESKKTNEPL